jgi:small subunit ribosomal protein S4
LIASRTKQSEAEQLQVLSKLQKLGLLSIGSELHQILGLELRDILERRLQTIVMKQGLARTVNQSRQFITHRHISVNGKEITSPSYILSLQEETSITFKEKSSLSDENHPERVQQKVETVAEAATQTVQEKVSEKLKQEKKSEKSKPENSKVSKENVASDLTTESKEEVNETS